MVITSVEIHPAIGIARVGNSPTEFFIGPERPRERPNPPGGFKDAQCRVKRQAARFRVFATHDDGSVVELTAADAQITWTVHLANKKATQVCYGVTLNPTGTASELTIDPGPRSVSGSHQTQRFDTGTITFAGAAPVTVPLGEIRTDAEGRLLVLGGFGHADSPAHEPLKPIFDSAGWFDDISDGPVSATVKLAAGGRQLVAQGAWVVVAPPKFATAIDNVVTLYDLLFDMAVAHGWRALPAHPSYTEHIHPILQRARDARWVIGVPGFAHNWLDADACKTDAASAPLREHIFGRLAPNGVPPEPLQTMPELAGVTLTAAQYELMTRWKDGDFVDDWSAPPPPAATVTPDGLDRAALENCVGAAFSPGIEVGGLNEHKPISDAANYTDAFRLDHAQLGPGDVTRDMCVPWQSDFASCSEGWWPAPRPTRVHVKQAGGSTVALDWDRGVMGNQWMVHVWPALGFVVPQGNEHVEVDRCPIPQITLLTPQLSFIDVPQGPMGIVGERALAVVFEVTSPASVVTLNVIQPPDHPRVVPITISIALAPTTIPATHARLWVRYTTGPVGERVLDKLVVRHVESGHTWTVAIAASTVARKASAVALILDRSGSMAEDRGDGLTKIASLRSAVSTLVDLMFEGDRLALVRYNQDAQLLYVMKALGPPGHTTRALVQNILAGKDLDPSGWTSIGDGIALGRHALKSGAAQDDARALVVLTDGKENEPLYIQDVVADIDTRTFAIALGTPQNTSVQALQAICKNTAGYLLVTGEIAAQQTFVLQKYFLQILAGLEQAQVVLDPEGELVAGVQHRIPFDLAECDTGIEVILLSPRQSYLELRLLTPSGAVIEPATASANSRVLHVAAREVSYYRVALPIEVLPGRRSQAGTWEVLVSGRPAPIERARERRVRRSLTAAAAESEFDALWREGRATLPYSVIVHGYSSVALHVRVEQASFEPGARVVLHALLSDAVMPCTAGAQVWAEVTEPGAHVQRIELTPAGDEHSASFSTSAAGTYKIRVRAAGRSVRGHRFQREQTRTAAVWHGSSTESLATSLARPLRESDGARDGEVRRLLDCLLAERTLSPRVRARLRDLGLDVAHLRKCLRAQADRPQRRPDDPDAR